MRLVDRYKEEVYVHGINIENGDEDLLKKVSEAGNGVYKMVKVSTMNTDCLEIFAQSFVPSYRESLNGRDLYEIETSTAGLESGAYVLRLSIDGTLKTRLVVLYWDRI